MTLSPDAKVQPKRSTLRSPAGFKFDVERTRTNAAAIHRTENLDIADGVQAETLWDASLDQLHDTWNGGLGILGRHEVEVAVAGRRAEVGHCALIDAMGVDDDPARGGLPEHLGQAYHRYSARADDVGQHLARSDGWQ